LLALSHVWKSPSGKKYLIAAKGAPEAIFELCHLKKNEHDKLIKNVEELSNEGLRVLGVARAYFDAEKLPENQHDFEFEFLGLVGLEDPVRPEVPAAVKECYDAGMRVIMITGDYPGTARIVAKHAGFKRYDDILTGAELENMSDEHLMERTRTVSIFARVVPEQKLRIVNALKANSEVVVMTGDGVNDAPALKAAGIGIAMGNRGTEVARESAALVLTDDNFASIVKAVRMGRRIYDNIKKAMAYIISVHIPIAGLSLLPIFMGWPIILYPVHIAFLELIIDPVCSVVFEAEPEERNIMKRKPRKIGERLFDDRILMISALRGLGILAVVCAVYYLSLEWNVGVDHARTITFTTLVLANLILVLSSRSNTRTIFETLESRNDSLWIVCGLAVLVLAMMVYVPFLQQLFNLTALQPNDILICVIAAVIGNIFFEIVKMRKKDKIS
jgi:Ca2+-transporting ATPase